MKLKKAFISNLDIIQVTNFATATSVTNTAKIENINLQTNFNEQEFLNNLIPTIQNSIQDLVNQNPRNLQSLLDHSSNRASNELKTILIENVISQFQVPIKNNNQIDLTPKALMYKANFLERYNTELKKNLWEKPRVTKIYTVPKQIKTEENWTINNDQNTSKVINVMYQRQSELLKEQEFLHSQLRNEQEIIKIYNIAIVTLTALAVVSSILAFLFPVSALVSAGLSTLAWALGYIRDYNVTRANSIRQSLKWLKQINATSYNETLKTTAKMSLDIYLIVNQINTAYELTSKVLTKAGANVLSGLSISYDIVSLFQSFEDLKKDYDDLRRIFDKMTQLQDLKKENTAQWEEFKKLNKIVVVSETPQTKAYQDGGTGGTNMIFKRLIDGKIFTRKQMLAMSKYELASYNLIKVKRTVTKNNKTYSYEYIRSKKSNKTLNDNLG